MRRGRAWLAVAGVMLATAACGHGSTSEGSAPAGQTSTTVPVTRGDLTEIVTLKAQVAPLAQFSVTATANGVLSHASLNPGAVVAVGQQLATSGGAAVSSPVAGALVRWLIPDGAQVAAGVPVAVLSYPGFAETATVPAEAAYRLLDGRLSARAEITSGPGPFDCALVQSFKEQSGDGGANDGGADGAAGTAGVPVVCAIPLDVKALSGLAGTIAVKSAEVKNTLMLPVAAVSGSAQHGEVSLVDGAGRTQVVSVGLGITNGSEIQITSGLSEGDRVLSVAPPLDARLP